MEKPENVGLKRKYEALRDELSWSVKDKMTLLKALKQYEYTDIDSISKMLPDKDSTTIQIMIDELITKSKVMKNRLPINNWLTSGLFKENDSLVPLALHFIELFETHSPSESGSCNYRSIYHFLYCLSLGKATPALQPESKSVLYSVLNNVMEEVWPSSKDQVLNYVAKLHKKQNNQKVYGGKKKSAIDVTNDDYYNCGDYDDDHDNDNENDANDDHDHDN